MYITAAYPWPRSESFLTPEIRALGQLCESIDVVPTRLLAPDLKLPAALPKNVRLVSIGLFDPGAVLALGKLAFEQPATLLPSIVDLFRSGLNKGLKNLAILFKAAKLAQLVHDKKIDHIHVHWAGVSATMAMLVSRFTGVQWSMTAHSWDIPENNLLSQKSAEAKFSRFISNREYAHGISIGVPKEKAFVLHVGVDIPAVVAPAGRRNNADPVRIACVAGFEEFKGHRFLLDAVHQLHQQAVPVHLTLYGDGPLRSQIKDQIKALSLEPFVELAGHTEHKTVLDQLSNGRFDLMVLASIVDSGGLDEGIPVSLIEAMSAGVPVISTRSGSIPELLPDQHGLSVPASDSTALANAIARLTKNPEQLDALRPVVRQIVCDQFDVTVIARQLFSRFSDHA